MPAPEYSIQYAISVSSTFIEGDMERVENAFGSNVDFALFIDNYPDAVWLKDKNLKIVRANSLYFEYFSKNSEISGKETADIDNQILQTGCNKVFNLRTQYKNRILSVTATPIKNNSRTEYIVYTSKDITSQEELKERFFVNKYQLNALLENVPKLIYMKDPEGKYITGTKYSKEFFEQGFDYFHKTHLDFPSLKDSNTHEDNFVIENNRQISYEKEINDTKGVPHWYKIYKAPINTYNNNVIGILVMVDNIDDEKLLQAQRETFVASLGHDLKNPTLAQIRAIELLLKGDFGEIPKAQKEILEMVLDSCRYMKALLSSLLATYRNERGVVTLNYEEVLLPDLTSECIGEMIYLAKDKGVNIKVEQNCTTPVVYGDKVQIKRVIMNLMSNGIKYAYKDSVITVKLYNESDYTCFLFENQSPYIPPEKREAIFAQYVSFAEAHKELGIGLGLYTSKKIVDAHGGLIFVKSFEDERNIFGFKIPNTKDNICAAKTVSF